MERIGLNRRVIRFVAGVCIAGSCIGCNTTQTKSKIVSGDIFEPLRLGMTRVEVAPHVRGLGDGFLVERASHFSPGGIATLSNGARIAVAFDEDSGRLFLISSWDPRFRRPGSLGVGSTYSELMEKLGDADVWTERGYATFVRGPRSGADGGRIYFCFDDNNTSPKEGDRVRRVELRNDLY